MSGITFPLTLNAGQTATLNIQFDPTSTGAATGQVTIAGNSSLAQITYVDTTAASGQTYDYVVKAFDAAGIESTASNMTSVTIP